MKMYIIALVCGIGIGLLAGMYVHSMTAGKAGSLATAFVLTGIIFFMGFLAGWMVFARPRPKTDASLAGYKDLSADAGPIPIAVSARHAHLNQETFGALFGAEAGPTHYKDLAQPGQFACEEMVTLIGPRGRIEHVRVLAPLRAENQIEISRTDEFKLGIDAPIRASGDVEGSQPVTLEGPAGTVALSQGLICARRHIHMAPEDARRFGVADRDEVVVAVSGGPRDLIFGDVTVRVKPSFKLEMHIDTDEANAAELERGVEGEVIYADVEHVSASLQSRYAGHDRPAAGGTS